MPDYTYAAIAYEAYRESSGGKSLVSGQPIPGFQHLPPAIQDAWFHAAEAVRKALKAGIPGNKDANDSERIDWLEKFVNDNSALLLHDGSKQDFGFSGLGLRPGSLVRTLRQAIDQTAGAERKESR